MKTKLAILAGALAIAGLHATSLLDHDLWTPDEPRVASIARQVSEGAWVVPTLNGTPFLEQPPLHVWCVAALYRLAGVEEPNVARLVSALFALGTVLGTYALGAAVAGRRVGVLAGLSLSLAAWHLDAAHRVAADSVLACWTTAATLCLVRAEAASSRGGRLVGFAAAGACAGLAFLAKNVVGLVFPALAWFAWSLARRRWRAPAGLLLAALATAAVTAPWLILLAERAGTAGLRELLVDNVLGRAAPAEAGSRSHLRPFWFYLVHFPADFAPATVLLAAAALARWRRRTELAAGERLAYDFGFTWLALGILVFSLASTKREVYLLPVYPGAALACGQWLDAFLRSAHHPVTRGWPFGVLAAALALLGVGTFTASLLLDSASVAWAVGAAVAGFGGAGLLWHALRARRPGRCVPLLAVGVAAVCCLAARALVPAIDAKKRLGPPCRQAVALVPPGKPLHALQPDETTEAMIPLYTGRHLVVVEDLAALGDAVREQGELYLLTVDKHGRKPQQVDLVAGWQPQLLLEATPPDSSRVMRLVRLRLGNP